MPCSSISDRSRIGLPPRMSTTFELSAFILFTKAVYALCGAAAETPTDWSALIPDDRNESSSARDARAASLVSLPYTMTPCSLFFPCCCTNHGPPALLDVYFCGVDVAVSQWTCGGFKPYTVGAQLSTIPAVNDGMSGRP